MAATEIKVQMQQRRDTAANWTSTNPTLLSGEFGYETDTGKFKVGNGSTVWTSLAYIPGFSISAYPITSTDIAAGAIANVAISSTAAIAVSKLATGTARQLLQTNAAGDGVEFASNIDVPGTLDVTSTATFDNNVTIEGDLTVNGATTTVNSTTLQVDDKNIELATVSASSFTGDITSGSADITNVSDTINLIPGVAIAIASGGGTVTLPATTVLSVSGTTVTLNDAFTGTGSASGATLSAGGSTNATADGGGITLKGATDKTLTWVDATTCWTFNQDVSVTATGALKVPVGTTAQRPGESGQPTVAEGQIRRNTTTSSFEGYTGSVWAPLGGGATGGGADAWVVETDQTVTQNYELSSGKHGTTVSPTINSNATVTVPSGAILVIL
tara:strand:- start:2244 stop:3404 length:1161 start_codon:yes stop_codon:yes gene_type:complete